MSYGQNSETNSISAQWQWMASGKTVFTVKWLGFWRDDKPFIPEDAPDHPGYINWWKWAAYGVNGAMPNVEAQKSSRNTLQADVSYYAEHFLGEHDIKFGIQYTKAGQLDVSISQLCQLRLSAPGTEHNYLPTGMEQMALSYNRQTW
jgi:hypothetical protein